MPHFDADGNDTFICQCCAKIKSSADTNAVSRPDITGCPSATTVCQPCADAFDAGEQPQRAVVKMLGTALAKLDPTAPALDAARSWWRDGCGGATLVVDLWRAITNSTGGPISVHEHCRQESGLEGVALDQYINRHYGHG